MIPSPPATEGVRLQSLTLRERLDAPRGAPAFDPAARAAADALVDRWRAALDRNGPGRFARRLQWDGLDEAEVRDALAGAPQAAPAQGWALLLDEACEAARVELDPADPALDPAQPVAFEEVLLPFVHAARARLRREVPELDRALAPAASAALERALLEELSAAAEQALLVDFSVARARGGARGFSLGGAPRTVYLGFVGALRAAGLRPLAERYPVLVRLLAVRALMWVETSAEFVRRALADAPALQALFGGGAPGRVAEARTGRGDTHCGGRTVAIVRFESGLQVVYKPRSLQLDTAFYGLLRWLAGRGLDPAQRVLAVLDRDGYGWVEFVHALPAQSEDELRQYYERAGALVCLAWLLGASDLHTENLIAAGAYPVPIDLEMMMGTQVDPGTPRSAAPAAPALSAGLLGTGLLPYWQLVASRPVFCGGGLGLRSADTRMVERVWTSVNTDRMSRKEESRPFPPQANVPRLDGRVVPAQERAADIVRGFERCHAFLEAHRAELAAPGGPLARFRGQRARVIVRDTRIYASALRGSLHPSHLHAGTARSVQLEILHTSAVAGEQPPAYWSAFGSEQRDLDDLDFPYFWSFTDGTVLHDARDTPVGTFCAASPYAQVLDRLARMDAADRYQQASLVRFIYALARGPAATAAAPRGDDAPAAGLDAGTALAEGRAIAGALEAMILGGPHASPQWVGVNRGDRNATEAMGPLSDRLYDGRPGVALFLAALDRVGGTGHAALATDALRPLRRAVRDPRALSAMTARMGLGAGFGLGGILYTLTQLARLTDDPELVDDARRAARAVTPGAIAADGALEVLAGTAGSLMALLSLHELTGDAWVLDAARACGAHLLAAARVEPGTGLRAWRPGGGAFGTGFAHGTGGIAAALLRLGEATGSPELADVAGEGFRFEAAMQAARGDHAHAAHAAPGTAGFSWSRTWCNGVTGVALGQAVYGRTAAAESVAAAGEGEIGASPDHACCGHLGRAELLLAAGHGDRARSLAGQVVARARAARSYHISREVPDARYSPAFFQGLSGIGYQLLRLTHPDALSPVLAFR